MKQAHLYSLSLVKGVHYYFLSKRNYPRWLKMIKKWEAPPFDFLEYQEFIKTLGEKKLEGAFLKFFPSPLYRNFFISYVMWCNRLPPSVAHHLHLWLQSFESGLGVFYFLFKQESVQEYLINNSHISQEQKGQLRKSPLQFSSPQDAWLFAQKIAYDMKKNLSTQNCEIKGRWKHFRVQISTPPVFPAGVAISLRPIFPPLNNLDLIFHNAGKQMENTLVNFLKKHRNIVISGETSAGKTSLLRWWIHTHLKQERMVIIDDSKELCDANSSPHILNFVFQQEKDSQNILKTALRFRPDKIIIGECRGFETISMLQSLRTGHWGSFSTLHAASLQDTLTRLKQLTLNHAPHYSEQERRELISPISAVIVLRRSLQKRIVHSLHWKEGEKWMSHQLYFSYS